MVNRLRQQDNKITWQSKTSEHFSPDLEKRSALTSVAVETSTCDTTYTPAKTSLSAMPVLRAMAVRLVLLVWCPSAAPC